MSSNPFISESFSKIVDDSFTDYAWTVIEDRAIPDCRDGMKPSQRRLMWAMEKMGVGPNSKTIKSAKIVGNTMANFHPHGNQSLYMAMVAMAQSWNMRYALVHSQGNFGSVDGDPPAADRYTEARMSSYGHDVVGDTNKYSVEFKDNYDNSDTEPSVLASKVPNLLLNGCSGIAVGYATNIPPHNYEELANLFEKIVKQETLTLDEIISTVPGPDFPTGGTVVGTSGIRDYIYLGKGTLNIEGKYNIITSNNGEDVIEITEFPDKGSPELFRSQIKDLAKADKISGISDVANYSSKKNGTKVIVYVGKNGNAKLILSTLLNKTCLRTTFSVNSTVIDNGKLREKVPLLDLAKRFLEFRKEVLLKQLNHEKTTKLHRVKIISAILKIIADIDKTVSIIKSESSTDAAISRLISENLCNDEIEGKAILALTLNKLVRLENQTLVTEKNELLFRISEIETYLTNNSKLMDYIVDEQKQLAKKHGNGRRTVISTSTNAEMASDKYGVEEKQVFVCISDTDLVKRIDAEEYKNQSRGGSGKSSSGTSGNYIVKTMFPASTYDSLLCFTNLGRVHRLGVHEIEQENRKSNGQHISKLLILQPKETVCCWLPASKKSKYILFVTKNGIVKKTETAEYRGEDARILSAINLDDGDTVAQAVETSGIDDIIITTRKGKGLRLSETSIKCSARKTRGCRGINLDSGDTVACVAVIEMKQDSENKITDPRKTHVVTVTTKGFAKKCHADEYMVECLDGSLCAATRGSKGKTVIYTSSNVGEIASFFTIAENDDIVVVTKKGKTLKTDSSELKQSARTSKGVTIVRMIDGDEVQTAFAVS